ncbi:MAG: DUF5522 domain-containing protein [Acidimicrobiales bacterium]
MLASIPHPHPSRCDPAREDYQDIIWAHELAVTEGRATYQDPSTGLMVLTVATHLARGTCCDSGCRHCPYLEQ